MVAWLGPGESLKMDRSRLGPGVSLMYRLTVDGSLVVVWAMVDGPGVAGRLTVNVLMMEIGPVNGP